ncbi:MAG: hypothetical protein GC180_07940 [Bacteroidetes bacterium]|nr:hypothetical protein [Bacteroidota bacterium]
MTNTTKANRASERPDVLELDLINGQYDAGDGFEIVHQLLLEKINFLQLKNFSLEIRYGQKDEHTKLRIKELEEAARQTMDYFKKFSEKEDRFDIEAKIIISKNS